MEKVQDPQNFRFCAIPQVMAVGTLALCYNNPKVFHGKPISICIRLCFCYQLLVVRPVRIAFECHFGIVPLHATHLGIVTHSSILLALVPCVTSGIRVQLA